MFSTISRISETSSTYLAQSALNPASKIQQALSKGGGEGDDKKTDRYADTYQRSDGTEATRSEVIKSSGESDSVADMKNRPELKKSEPKREKVETERDKQFRELLHQFAGQVFFGQMLKSMRATQEKNPYFHGGQAEEIFQSQLDMVLTDEMTKSTTKTFSEPMHRLMTAKTT